MKDGRIWLLEIARQCTRLARDSGALVVTRADWSREVASPRIGARASRGDWPGVFSQSLVRCGGMWSLPHFVRERRASPIHPAVW